MATTLRDELASLKIERGRSPRIIDESDGVSHGGGSGSERGVGVLSVLLLVQQSSRDYQ